VRCECDVRGSDGWVSVSESDVKRRSERSKRKGVRGKSRERNERKEEGKGVKEEEKE
jgi:hypothetical protein